MPQSASHEVCPNQVCGSNQVFKKNKIWFCSTCQVSGPIKDGKMVMPELENA